MERENFSHLTDEVPQAREVSKERGGKRRKTVEEGRRTDQFFFLTS